MGHAATPAWSLRAAVALAFVAELIPSIARTEEPERYAASRFANTQQALDPVGWMLAQAPSETASSAPSPPPPQDAPAPIPPARGLWGLFANEGRGPMQLAPLRWSGSVGGELRFGRSDLAGRRDESIEFVNVDMATYIAEPWFAQVRANVGILASQQRNGGVDTVGQAASTPADADRTVTLNGGASLMVFPASRFPFTATFSSNDSRSSDDASASDYVNRIVTLLQSYRSPLGDRVMTGFLERSVLTSESFGRDAVTTFGGTFQRTFANHLVDVNGNYSRNQRTQDESSSELGRLSAHHNWHPDDLVNVDSYASVSTSDFSGPTFAAQRSRFVQVNSFGTWRPEDESSLLVTGGLRFSDATLGVAGLQGQARGAGADVSASYALGPAAQMVGSASIGTIRAGDASVVVTTQTLGANYNPSPVPLGPVSYSWGSALVGTNQTGGLQARQHTVVGQLYQQVSATQALTRTLATNESLNQSFSVEQDSVRGASHTLANTASMGTRFSPTSASDAYFNLSAGDSRTEGARRERFQILNAQATGNLQLGAYSLLSANLTVQALRQDQLVEGEQRHSVQRSGAVSYQHERFFNVRRLRLLVTATFNDVSLDSRLQGNVNAPHEQYNRLIEERLQYDIGRLDFRLGMRFATFEGHSDRQIYFRVNRQFGIN